MAEVARSDGARDSRSYADAVALRATQATPILLQVRSDVTRYRYGDEQHLDEALLRIFRINKSGGIRRNQAPVLARLREEVIDGKYALVLGFDSTLPMPEWEVRSADALGCTAAHSARERCRGGGRRGRCGARAEA